MPIPEITADDLVAAFRHADRLDELTPAEIADVAEIITAAALDPAPSGVPVAVHTELRLVLREIVALRSELAELRAELRR